MQVTLKKASELSRALLAAVKTVDLPSKITVSAYSTDDIADLVITGKKRFSDTCDRVTRMVRDGYLIREAIAEANGKADIGRKLTEVAALDEMIARLYVASTDKETVEYGYSPAVTTTDMVALSRRVEQMRTDIGNSELRVRPDNLVVDLVSGSVKNDLDDVIAILRRKRVTSKDAIAALNHTTMVDLSDDIVATLRSEKLID